MNQKDINQKNMNRRGFMKLSGAAAAGMVLIPVCNLEAAETAAQAKLSPDEPMAKSLGYVEKTPIAGSTCGNCLQSKGDAGAQWVACAIFPGKQVNTAGWCKVWSKKP